MTRMILPTFAAVAVLLAGAATPAASQVDLSVFAFKGRPIEVAAAKKRAKASRRGGPSGKRMRATKGTKARSNVFAPWLTTGGAGPRRDTSPPPPPPPPPDDCMSCD